MFETVLIANRGEIAARIARTCKEMGIHTIAIHSDADDGAPHTQIADESHHVGAPHVSESYLNQDKILEIARATGAQAIHPGYGLLSEHAGFVRAVRDAGLTFIGPEPEVMELMGDKAKARSFAEQAGVPVVPGTPGPIADEDAAVAFAEEAGYPVLVKASGGGGGIGMKLAKKEKKLRKAVQECRRRGESAFDNPDVYVEKYIERPRHIEVQLIADAHGNVRHLFERECTVQRRHQKVIEEAPSPFMERFPALRAQMTSAAVALASASGYVNAGTVEFIVGEDGSFYFIEMNTRLQVEHPVTEMITGLDIVRLQLEVAAGGALPFAQSDLAIRGHAIECRIYAENPEKSFFPAPGQITTYVEPSGQGVRVDSGVSAGREVTSFYDPMISKVSTHGTDPADPRGEAIAKMLTALHSYEIGGLTHNISMHERILTHDDFITGDVHTTWLEGLYKG
ncbi:MAG: acetyl-CoA carboxylase biotin carboxylase subunit [Myxococcota bacterium]